MVHQYYDALSRDMQTILRVLPNLEVRSAPWPRVKNRAFISIGGSASFTTVAHELSHTFGLQHDFKDTHTLCPIVIWSSFLGKACLIRPRGFERE